MSLNSYILRERPCLPQGHSALRMQVVVQRGAPGFDPGFSSAVAYFNNQNALKFFSCLQHLRLYRLLEGKHHREP